MSEINVTPFVDVMLVLLIIFMVTAPLLTVGVQVDLPESAADSLPDDQEPLTITINSKGEIFIQEHQVTFQKVVPKSAQTVFGASGQDQWVFSHTNERWESTG